MIFIFFYLKLKDIFLPHVESGVLTLIGATTENPSFSLNSALLSRCRVIVLEKLPPKCIIEILKRSLRTYNAVVLDENNEYPPLNQLDFTPKYDLFFTKCISILIYNMKQQFEFVE